MKTLVVEDETDLNSVITKFLKKEGYSVDSAYDGKEALNFLEFSNYDILIVDIMMPKMNGYELIKKIRSRRISTPVLILTAKDSLDDRVKGLDLGADDYVIKPFKFEELTARIRALIRRSYGYMDDILKVDTLAVNISEKSVTRNGKYIELTGKEYELLEYLVHNKGKIITRSQMQEHVWDYNYEGASNVIDVLIKNIRKKINIDGAREIIFTKRGLGYVVKGE